MTIILYVTNRARTLKTLAVNTAANNIARVRFGSTGNTILMTAYIVAGTLFAVIWAVAAGISVDFEVVITQSHKYRTHQTSSEEYYTFSTKRFALWVFSRLWLKSHLNFAAFSNKPLATNSHIGMHTHFLSGWRRLLRGLSLLWHSPKNFVFLSLRRFFISVLGLLAVLHVQGFTLLLRWFDIFVVNCCYGCCCVKFKIFIL